MYIGEKMKYYLVSIYILLVGCSWAWASDTPELVPAQTDDEGVLQPDMASTTTLYKRLMWAVYCRTGEYNLRESRNAYDALVDEFCVDSSDNREGSAPSLADSSTNTTVLLDEKGSSFIYTQRAVLRFNPILQNLKGAEEDCRKAIALNLQNVPATWLLARILIKRFFSAARVSNRVKDELNLQQEMLTVLKRVIELDADHARAQEYLGSIASRIGQTDLAIASFKALTRIMPFEWQYHMELGDLYKAQNQIQDAILSYERVVTILPGHTGARNHLGKLYLQVGIDYQMLDDVERAETYLRKAIASSPDEVPDAYNALGYLYAEQGIKLDEAAVLVQRALQTLPTSGAYLDSLGLIYFKQGKIDAAIATLEKALRYMPETPEILLHLGDAYLQKGLKQKAVQTFEQAVQLVPDNAALREKLDTMKSQ